MNIAGIRNPYVATAASAAQGGPSGGVATMAADAGQDAAWAANGAAAAPRHGGASQVSAKMLAHLLSLTPEGATPRPGRLGVAHLALRSDAAPSWDSLPGDPMAAPATASQIAAQLIRDLGTGGAIGAGEAQAALAPASLGASDEVKALIGRYVRAHDRDGSGGLEHGELRDLIERMRASAA